MLEHVMYAAKGETRVMLASKMPDAYQRLMGHDDATIRKLRGEDD